MESNQVLCPACDRVVRLNVLGAKDMQGRPVMEWHTDHAALKSAFRRRTCVGSDRSAEGVVEFYKETRRPNV